MRPSSLALAITTLLAAPAMAADPHPHREEAKALDAVVVTASPLATSADDLARPAAVLADEALDDARRSTLGDTLERLPGVQSASFGPGVGRPIVRGLDGARVQVLANSLSSLDASTVSADHAIAVEPFLADQIEVLKGPANLFFGSGAIGGAVNVVDNRTPTVAADRPVSGRAELRAGSGTGERAGLFRLDGGSANVVWHVDGLVRTSDDVAIPGFALADDLIAEELEEGESLDDLARGRVPNTATDTTAASTGLGVVGDRGFLGASISRFATRYGIPEGAHGHHEHEHESLAKAGDDEDEAPIDIDLTQTRGEIRGGLNDLGILQSLTLRAVNSDYEHVELEGNEIGTRFLNNGQELRLEAVQTEVAGWNGAFGVQSSQRDFEAIGDEAFVPATRGSDLGVFLMQQREFGALALEAGLRHDRVRTDLADGSDGRDVSANSASLGLRWAGGSHWHLGANIDHAERAPTAEELFSDGAHVATATYEVGDASLSVETAQRIELSAHWHADNLDVNAAVYRTAFSDFIYLADTGREEDDLPVRQWTAADATFTGWEIEGRYTLADDQRGRWVLRGFADAVRATLDAGGNLPRIAPPRLGAGLEWSRDAWRAGVDVTHVQRQSRVAEGEEATAGFTRVDAQVSYHWDTATFGWETYLQGRNLSNRDIRQHTSYLKEYAPQAGRSITAGVRVFF